MIRMAVGKQHECDLPRIRLDDVEVALILWTRVNHDAAGVSLSTD